VYDNVGTIGQIVSKEANETYTVKTLSGYNAGVYANTDLSNISGVAQAKFDAKVDKVIGKGLSTNDLTNALKESYDAGLVNQVNRDLSNLSGIGNAKTF
jgi:hypothetical protein